MLTKSTILLAAALLLGSFATAAVAKDRVSHGPGQPAISYEESNGHVPTNLYQGW